MGPNGSGKSTLSYVLAGRDGYEVTEGEVAYKGQDLLAMSAEERARAGVFLAFQYPVEIPGVANSVLPQGRAQRRAQGTAARRSSTPWSSSSSCQRRLKMLKMDETLLNRAVNAGFSGGEKKRNEILQMAMLEPTLAILDETDSGLDIDALRIVAERRQRAAQRPSAPCWSSPTTSACSNYIVPDYVHVLAGGRIVRSGGKELALELEEKGYAGVTGARARREP